MAEQKSKKGGIEGKGEKRCLEIGDACMDYGSGKWRSLTPC